jgi:transposase
MSKILVRLSHSQRAEIQRLKRCTNKKVEALRCQILLLLDDGLCVKEVSKCVGCVRATVYRTIYRFEDEDVEGIVDGRSRRAPVKATEQAVAQLLAYLDKSPKDYGWQRSVWTQELLSMQLHCDIQVSLSASQISRVLRQNKCRRGRPRPALAIPVRGRRAILDAIEKRVRLASPDEEVFYMDEADIDLNPRIGLTYIKRGQQPLVLTPGKNVKYYIAGALNARTGSLVYTHGTKKDSNLFIALVNALSAAYRRPRKIHVILDNYIIHKSGVTREAVESLGGRVQLHFLPPYSPNHNRIERLWKQMHDNVTRNHQHPTMESLWKDVVGFLEAVQPFPGTQVSTLRKIA